MKNETFWKKSQFGERKSKIYLKVLRIIKFGIKFKVSISVLFLLNKPKTNTYCRHALLEILHSLNFSLEDLNFMITFKYSFFKQAYTKKSILMIRSVLYSQICSSSRRCVVTLFLITLMFANAKLRAAPQLPPEHSAPMNEVRKIIATCLSLENYDRKAWGQITNVPENQNNPLTI